MAHLTHEPEASLFEPLRPNYSDAALPKPTAPNRTFPSSGSARYAGRGRGPICYERRAHCPCPPRRSRLPCCRAGARSRSRLWIARCTPRPLPGLTPPPHERGRPSTIIASVPPSRLKTNCSGRPRWPISSSFGRVRAQQVEQPLVIRDCDRAVGSDDGTWESQRAPGSRLLDYGPQRIPPVSPAHRPGSADLCGVVHAIPRP